MYERQLSERAPSGACTIIAPFPIGVVHRAEDAEVDWAGDTAIVALPDWDAMLAGVEAAAE